jgi:hypothetical protein
MKPKPQIVGIFENADKTVTTWHMMGTWNDYATLCGIDGDDPICNQFGVTFGKSTQKIDCPACLATWKRCQEYKIRNFLVDPDN